MPEIIIDSRETRSEVPRWLERLGVATGQAEMQVGDYMVADAFLVERKAANDFALSIMDGRLFGQAELLASNEARGMIVVEGSLAEINSAIDPEALAGALSALVVFFEMPVITVPGPEQTARLLARLARHVTEGLGYEIPLRKKPKFDGSLAQFLVEGLPGVGPETARKLIGHFGTPRQVFAASAADLQQVKGIGGKTAASIQTALDARPTGYRSTKTGTR